LAGLGYVGIVTTPPAIDMAATLPTDVGTTAVTRMGHGRVTRPLVETVAGMVPALHDHDPAADDDDDVESHGAGAGREMPAMPHRAKSSVAKPAPRAKRSRGRND